MFIIIRTTSVDGTHHQLVYVLLTYISIRLVFVMSQFLTDHQTATRTCTYTSRTHVRTMRWILHDCDGYYIVRTRRERMNNSVRGLRANGAQTTLRNYYYYRVLRTSVCSSRLPAVLGSARSNSERYDGHACCKDSRINSYYYSVVAIVEVLVVGSVPARRAPSVVGTYVSIVEE